MTQNFYSTPEHVYQDEVHRVLPRLLASFDQSPTSPSYGLGDRYHWSWALIDFANGTHQGAAHGLARLIASDSLPPGYCPDKIFHCVESIFHGAQQITRSNGSLEEAFPYEGSFCVTALVAFDLLCAIEILDKRLPSATKERFLNIVEPMITCLVQNDETHAFISNHLATASAALFKWNSITGATSQGKAEELLERILDHQSPEGWYLEYDGADPGYQSLCTYYLAAIHQTTEDPKLLASLKKSVEFLWQFAHPDGSFGGIYGSRNTRFYYPAGIDYLASFSQEAASLSQFMRKSIAQRRVVTLDTMDPANLIPMFNSYAWSATLKVTEAVEAVELPCESKRDFRRHWPDAGLVIDSGPAHYTIVSGHKGGVVYHFHNGSMKVCDSGVLIRNGNNKYASTQAYAPQNQIEFASDSIEIRSKFFAVRKRLPKPWQFAALRACALTIMRNHTLRERVKQGLVRFLINGKSRSAGDNVRKIRLGPDLIVNDESKLNSGWSVVEGPGVFVSIHMASQGYWQIQDVAKETE